MKALLFVCLVAGVIACGDSTSPGLSAANVTGVAGDSQTAPTGAALAFPLSLVTLGPDGQPLQGVSVKWTVAPSGGATFAPSPSVSDVSGQVSTAVTLGSVQGDITISANVPGVPAVKFHALAVDPCQFISPYTVGQSVSGVLTTRDCLHNTFYYDLYALELTSPQSLRITMKSSSFDSYLELYRFSDGRFVGFDDDVVIGEVADSNSQLDIILPLDTFFIGASTYRSRALGGYTIATEARPAEMNGCSEVWVVRGVTVADSVTAADCADSSATPHHYDVARIYLESGTTLTMAERSTAMNANLALYQITDINYGRTLVASNDDSLPGVNTNSFISYAVTANGTYDVLIGTSAGGETGAYEFEVSPKNTPTAPRVMESPLPGKAWRGEGALAADAMHMRTRVKL